MFDNIRGHSVQLFMSNQTAYIYIYKTK